MQEVKFNYHNLWAWEVSILMILLGCTSINLKRDFESTGMEQPPTRLEQLDYDNFMLGRLKYYEANPDIDLITIAFIDQRSNNNEKLDEFERELLGEFQKTEKLYFSVGYPIYNLKTGREVGKEDLFRGTPTSNPLDYLLCDTQPMWKGIRGCYVEFKDAFRLLTSNLGQQWGIIEVDFSDLVYGRPVRVTKVWRLAGLSGKELSLPIKDYQLKPEICKLSNSNFKIIYPP